MRNHLFPKREAIVRDVPEFVEIGPRLYAVEVVEPFAWVFDGKNCHVDHAGQTIYLNASLSEDAMADVLGRAARLVMSHCCPQWRMIPLVGKIS